MPCIRYGKPPLLGPLEPCPHKNIIPCDLQRSPRRDVLLHVHARAVQRAPRQKELCPRARRREGIFFQVGAELLLLSHTHGKSANLLHQLVSEKQANSPAAFLFVQPCDADPKLSDPYEQRVCSHPGFSPGKREFLLQPAVTQLRRGGARPGLQKVRTRGSSWFTVASGFGILH